MDGTLELIVDGVGEEKLTARAHRAALDMARLRELAAGDLRVGRLLSAAFMAMAAVTLNHAAEFLPGGICAAESITTRLGSSPAASVQPRASPPRTASA
eukprot:4423076-Pleurochrysis_carterae.AAC.1